MQQLGKKMARTFYTCIWICRPFHHCTNLSVHEDVNDGVVNGGTLGKIGRQRGSQWMETVTRVGGSKAGKECVRSPTKDIGYDHDHDHPGDFTFSLLGGFRLLLLLGYLEDGRFSINYIGGPVKNLLIVFANVKH